MPFDDLRWTEVSRDQFVEIWAARYADPLEPIYDKYIGKPFSAESVFELFRWKNGGKLSEKKRASVRRNFVDRLPELEALSSETRAAEFLERWRKGGAIWRIFWLHCWRPDRYPIYDQHVHRAAARIEGWSDPELPDSPAKQVGAYLNRYLPFCAKHGFLSRVHDQALWTYGKCLKAVRRWEI